MEASIAAVTGELVSRFISFLMNKYHSLSHAQSEKVVDRLQHLLMRVSIVVEEADGRYITNSGMILQLKMLSDAMYRGHRTLDTLRYQTLQDSADSSSSSLHLSIPSKRSRTKTENDDKAMRLESEGALESLEIAVANMVEFVMLLGGCERMSRRPYDTYLYTNNFMFSRHAEKQKLLRFLLEHNDSRGDHAPAVLPIIGGGGVGKKALVAHVCGDEQVRSRFSSILHLNGDNLLAILDHGRTMFGMMLVVIEFASDVVDNDWGKLKRLARFGSVQPIFLSVLSYDELRYLFKTLAFGSVDPAEHPQLVQIADEFTRELHSVRGSLVEINVFTDALRRNHHAQFWRCILDKGMKMVKRNLSSYGLHPNKLIEQGRPVDITDLALHPLSLLPYTLKEESPSVTLGDLLADPSVRPEGDFTLIAWKSRIPPHRSYLHCVTSRAQDVHEGGA
uniref:Disease resistance N-terminal domain-containing protein n=1 Tax=Aegilops tauschii subsp. strangulata TaxID=200361 RepID=A0A453T237_AEGTS